MSRKSIPPADTVYGRFARTAETHADRPFIRFEDETITYDDAFTAVGRRADVLATHGVGKGDRVGLLFENDPEFIFLLVAIARLGATVVPLDYRQSESTLEYLLTDAELSALIVDRSAIDIIEALCPTVPIDTVFTYTDECRLDGGIDLASALVTADRTSPIQKVMPQDVAMINYTSGTTGQPKGVMNPHRAFVDGGDRSAAACRTDCTDRAMLILPLFHANPLTYGLFHMLAVGGSIGLVRSFSASTFWDTARDLEATFFTHVGSVLEILWQTADDKVIDTDTPLVFAMGGAGQFAEQRAFENRFDIQIVRLYGLSEMGGGLVTIADRDPESIHGSPHQGSIATQPFDVQILAENGSKWAAPDERGEILTRPTEPATMFQGYRGKADQTVEDWQDLWMHTGDLGYLDENSNLWYVGRMKTSIRRYGENISPWEIESVIREWDAVDKSVAIGVPDPVAGEEIKLYVIPENTGLDEETVAEWCDDQLPNRLRPRYVELITSLPTTSTQKIERVALKERGIDGAWDRAADGQGR